MCQCQVNLWLIFNWALGAHNSYLILSVHLYHVTCINAEKLAVEKELAVDLHHDFNYGTHWASVGPNTCLINIEKYVIDIKKLSNAL